MTSLSRRKFRLLTPQARRTLWSATDTAPSFEDEGNRAAGARYVVAATLVATVHAPARAVAVWATCLTPCWGDDTGHRVNGQLLAHEPSPLQVRNERIELHWTLLRKHEPRFEGVSKEAAAAQGHVTFPAEEPGSYGEV